MSEFAAWLFGIFFGVIGMSIIYYGVPVESAYGYKHGQIDAQSGKIHWVLKDQPDGSRTWTWKE
jgi:hypothetical protein